MKRAIAKTVKIIIKCIIGIICAVLVFALFLIGWNVVVISGVNNVSETSFALPGADDHNYNMQAIAWDEESKLFFFSGYMKNKEACPVYLMTPDEKVTRINLLREDGSKLVNHAGGIEVCGDFVYLAGSVDDCLYVFSRSEILNTADGGSVRSIGTFSTAVSAEDGIKPALMTAADGKLFVGEFHFPVLPWYKLRKNHHIGSTHAIMAAFTVNPEKPLGLEETPCEAYCLPEMTQGVAMNNGDIFLARSYFLFPSEIARYQPVRSGSMTLLGKEVPLYTLTKTAGVRMPPFAEEIEILDDDLYISTEICYYLPSWIYNMWDGAKCRRINLSVLSR